jgi:hypothetical protein
MTVKELKQICKNKNIKGVTKFSKAQFIEKIMSNDNNPETVIETTTTVDTYTPDVLNEQFQIHNNYVRSRIESGKKLNINFRLPSIPEDISENMIKFIIHKNGDTTSTWNCKGDLLSLKEGKQECKCFTSTGPISFTPSSEWNCIYFLDATNWLQNHFILFRFPYSRTSDEWKNIKMNKTQTFEDQALQGRRPRLNWHALLPQIKDKCDKIFEGTFENIIS